MMAQSCDPFTPPLPGAVKFFIVPAGERERESQQQVSPLSPPPHHHLLIFTSSLFSPPLLPHLLLLITFYSSSPPHPLLLLLTTSSSSSPPLYHLLITSVMSLLSTSHQLCCSSAPPRPATPSSFLLLLLLPLLSPPSLLSRMLGLVLLWFCSFGLLRLSSSLVHGNIPLEGPGTDRHVESSYLSEGGESSCPITALTLTCHWQVNTPVPSARFSKTCLFLPGAS